MSPTVCYVLYLWLRNLFLCIQRLIRRSFSKGNRQRTEQAECMKILWRKKYHPFLVANGSDFVGLHEGIRSPDCILPADVSLYSIDGTTATFVQMPSSVPLYSPGNIPHMYVTQYKKAVKLIQMPLEVFCQVAGGLPIPSVPVVLLSNTAKCGCSVLMDSVHATGQIQTLWEPDALTNLVHAPVSEMDSRLRNRVLEATLRYLCRQRLNSPHVKGHFIKIRSHVSKLLPAIHQAAPWVRHLFAYSKPLDQICASMAAFEKTPLKTLWKTPGGRRAIFETNPELGKALDQQVNSYFTSTCWMWAQPVAAFIDARNSGVHVSAISYESLLSDTDKAFDAVWQYCGFGDFDLPAFQLESMKTKLQWLEDRREQAKESYAREYTGKGKADADIIAATLQVPGLSITSEDPLPGTLPGTWTLQKPSKFPRQIYTQTSCP